MLKHAELEAHTKLDIRELREQLHIERTSIYILLYDYCHRLP